MKAKRTGHFQAGVIIIFGKILSRLQSGVEFCTWNAHLSTVAQMFRSPSPSNNEDNQLFQALTNAVTVANMVLVLGDVDSLPVIWEV